jgi:predicted HTH transcriptional regulator
MNASDVLRLISQGEGQQLEFKRSLAELDTATRTVVAFANTDGGVILFGVRDSGEIIGVEWKGVWSSSFALPPATIALI